MRRSTVAVVTTVAILGAATAYLQPVVVDALPARVRNILAGSTTTGRSIEERSGRVLDMLESVDRLMTMRTIEVLDLGAIGPAADDARAAAEAIRSGGTHARYFTIGPPPQVWTRSGAHDPGAWRAGHRRVIEVESGWPMRSSWTMMSWDQSVNEAPLGPVARQGAIHLFSISRAGVWVPFWVLSVGLATNAVVYSAAWAMVVLVVPAVVRALRRRRRARGGRCVACGYSLAGTPSGPCPECGTIGGRHRPLRATSPRIERF